MRGAGRVALQQLALLRARGGVEHAARAVDVSEAGDWSLVKVWYGPNGGLGTSSYPTHGFIYSGAAPVDDTPVIRMASADVAGPVIAR